MDDWFFGHPQVMDKFSNMFDYIWIDKKYSDNTLMHIFPAEYLHQIGIHNMSLNSMNVLYLKLLYLLFLINLNQKDLL